MEALLRLGSKSSDAFRREGQSWHCTTGLPSDLTIEVGQVTFFLHKFPLLSRSGLLKKLIADSSKEEEGASCVLQLDDVPGGDKTFDLVTRFCYGVLIEVVASNVVPLRCAAEYLEMNENYGESNLIGHTESFLNQVLSNWLDTIKALQSCEEVMSYAQQLNIVSRCIDFLTLKACPDPRPAMAEADSLNEKDKSQTKCDDWWYEDLSLLSLPLYKRLILSLEAKGMKPENIAGSLIRYITRYVPLMNRQSSFKEKNNNNDVNQGTNFEADQRAMVEEIVAMLPSKKGVTASKYLLRMLRTAMLLHASQSCIDTLEKRIGSQLEQAMLVDLLIPNMGQPAETLYDTDCIQRIVDHFLSIYLPATASTSPSISMHEEGPLASAADSLTPMTIVANLVDAYLAEVALDVNFKLPKFQALATAIPEYARPIDDGLYHAIDVYLKAHPWLVDSEREQFCRLMNCQKLSLEASTHAAQNERLPLRVIVQVLFFEQLRLRTSISSWLFDDTNNFENSQQQNSLNGNNLGHLRSGNNGQVDPSQQQGGGNLRERVSELEKECTCIRKELHKLAKSKRGWNIFQRIFFRKRSC